MSNGPTRGDSQSLGDIGESTVQLILRKFKWSADIIKSDFGEDIESNVFIDNTRTNYHLRCQVKSTTEDSKYVKELKSGEYSVSINSGTLKAWLSSYFPVFLVIYDESTDSCFWTSPVKQILDNPSKLEREAPSIRVSKENVFDSNSRDIILSEVKEFYHKILRLDEATMSCKVTPVLMPNYRVIPFHHFYGLLNSSGDENLHAEPISDFIELLPAWMTILKKLDPTNTLPSIRFSSNGTIDLDKFLDSVKLKMESFIYDTKPDEWLSFIVSPIEIVSDNSSWMSELTYWTAYSKMSDAKFVSDYLYDFEAPVSFLRQVSRRARSWDFNHYVHPEKDIAIQFFAAYEVTPALKNINQIHKSNISGQFILWECAKTDFERVIEELSGTELSVSIIEDENEINLFAITVGMFEPSLGLYSVAMDWDNFENGQVRNFLEKSNLINTLPGNEYKGKLPEIISDFLDRYNRDYKTTRLTEMEYIAGLPLLHNDREIHVSRFQMISPDSITTIEEAFKTIEPINKRNFNVEFFIKDDSWSIPIYELLITWSPDLVNSCKEDYEEVEADLLKLMNYVLPSQENPDIDIILKNTYHILSSAGEIGFEERDSEPENI